MKTVLGVILLAAVVLGCGRADTPAGYLRMRLADNPTTLDPAYIVDVPGGALAARIFNGLVRFDIDGRIVPDAAEDWTVSADGRIYTFFLRSGVKFHNGREATADDFVYSFRRLLDPAVNSPRFRLMSKIRGADAFRRSEAQEIPGLRARGERVVEIELNEPSSLFLNYLAMPNAAVIPAEAVEADPERFSRRPVGTGPFRLTEWEHNRHLVLDAHDGYFLGPPALAGIHLRVIPEDMTAALEFERGNLDLLEIPRAEFDRYTTRAPWKGMVRSRPGLNTFYLGFNCERTPLADPRLRRAFNYAIDREAIVDRLLQGRAAPADGPVPGVLWSRGAGGGGYRYDPDQARSLLAETGLEPPIRLTLLFRGDRETLSVAEVIQDYLRRVGVELVLVQREWSSFLQAVNEGDFDLFYLSWWADYPDPENFLYPVFYSGNRGPAGNRSRFSDPEVDALLRAARRSVDPAAREELYLRAAGRVREASPWVFLWHRKNHVIVNPRVMNYRLPLIYNGDDFHGVGLVAD